MVAWEKHCLVPGLCTSFHSISYCHIFPKVVVQNYISISIPRISLTSQLYWHLMSDVDLLIFASLVTMKLYYFEIWDFEFFWNSFFFKLLFEIWIWISSGIKCLSFFHFWYWYCLFCRWPCPLPTVITSFSFSCWSVVFLLFLLSLRNRNKNQ